MKNTERVDVQQAAGGFVKDTKLDRNFYLESTNPDTSITKCIHDI